MHCEDLRVETVFLIASDENGLPFEARGRLNFLTAIIGGSFFMTNARLAPGPDYTGLLRKGGPIAVNLQQARISNALALRNTGMLGDESGEQLPDSPATPVRGWFLLTGAQVSVILDDVETGWPAAGFLDIEGLTYSRCYLYAHRLAATAVSGTGPGPGQFSSAAVRATGPGVAPERPGP